MNNPLARQHNILLLERYQNWRLGNDERTLYETGLTPKVITAVIDWAIGELKRIEDDGKMKIKLGTNQPTPKYQTPGSAGFDLCATETVHITSGVHMMNLEIACEIPSGFYGKLVVRSSMSKRGIMLAHGTGVIDSDFRGFIHAPLYSRNPLGSTVEHGERIVQLLICPVFQVGLNVVDELSQTSRAGGFGSTGK